MPAKVVTLCEAVVDFLNGESYSQSFTATRTNAGVNQLEDTNDLQVTVFPGDYQVEIESRDAWRRTYSVFVVVQKNTDTKDDEDEMLELVEEIESSLENEDMGEFVMVGLVGTLGGRTPVQADQLLTAGQFVSAIEVNYIG